MKHKPFPSTFFSRNRQMLREKLPKDSLALVQSAELMVRNNDMYHFWRQDSNFFYLTGIEQSGCSFLLTPNAKKEEVEILFIPPIDPEREKWEGEMLTVEKAKELSAIETVYPSYSFESVFFRSQKWCNSLYCEVNDVFPDQPLTNQHLLLKNLSVRLPGLTLKKLDPLTAALRVIKSPEEIEYLRKSISITEKGLRAVMSKIKPGMMEYEVEAELAYHYLANGCTRLGFDTIAASGKNATALHYTQNSDQLQDGDLILIDTGGEYGMYSGDVTRVIPINGKFSERQKFCYQAVLEVQEAAIREIKPGISYQEFFKTTSEVQGSLMKKYGFVEDPKKHQEITFHRIGHYLGLDVHDVGSMEWSLQPGMVITIEPGLYLKEEGIGIRIEDDILITENSIEILSQSIPKKVEDIEALVNN